MNFSVQATATSGLHTEWNSCLQSSTHTPSIPCSVPQYFGGPGKDYSPEDLLALSLANCFVGTFKVIAKNSNFEFSKINVQCSIELDQPSSSKFVTRRALIKVSLDHSSDPAKAESLLRVTKKAGIILNSVSFPIEYI